MPRRTDRTPAPAGRTRRSASPRWTAERHQLLIGTARTAFTTTGAFVVYSVLPLDRAHGAAVLLLLLGGLLAVVVLVAWQVRAILRSPLPALRGLEAAALSLALFLLLFAATYVLVAGADPGAFTEPLDHVDGIYFTVTVFATVGFGDITPVGDLTRILVTTQMLGDLALIGVGLRAILLAVQDRRRHRPPNPSHDGGDRTSEVVKPGSTTRSR